MVILQIKYVVISLGLGLVDYAMCTQHAMAVDDSGWYA